MTRGPQMCDVELVEVGLDGPDDGPAAGPGSGVGDARTRSGSWRGWRGRGRRPGAVRGRRLAGLTALALVGLTAVVVGERREATRLAALAALADVAGVVAPVDGPVEVRWQLAGAWGGPLRSVDGRVAAVVHLPRGAIEVVALDAATGADVWRTEVSRLAHGSEPSASCEVPAAAAGGTAPVVVCLVVDDMDTADVVGIASATYPTRTRLMVLDARTGAVLRDEPVAATTSATALGPDVLLTQVDDDGYAHVTRTDPRDGVVRWSFRTPVPVPPDELGQRWIAVHADAELVLLDAGGTWALTTDGELLRSWPELDPTEVLGGRAVELLDGRGLVLRATADDRGAWNGEVVDVRTGAAFPVGGYPSRLGPDDGSLDDVLLVDDGVGDRTGYDVGSGRPLWTVPGAARSTSLVLDGRVVMLDATGLRAVDGRTGERVWSTDLEQAVATSMVTDGRLLLVATAGRSGEGLVIAYGADDGRVRWSTELGTDVYLDTLDGAVYGYGPGGVVVLGPAGGED